MDTSDSSTVFGASLKDAGGPAINVLTKLVALVSMLNTAQNNWAFFILVMGVAICIAAVFAYNVWKTGQGSLDQTLLHEAANAQISSLHAHTTQHLTEHAGQAWSKLQQLVSHPPGDTPDDVPV